MISPPGAAFSEVTTVSDVDNQQLIDDDDDEDFDQMYVRNENPSPTPQGDDEEIRISIRVDDTGGQKDSPPVSNGSQHVSLPDGSGSWDA